MRLERFTGLDLENSPRSVGLSGLTVALNCDIDRKGRITRRRGYRRVFDGVVDDVWSDGRDFLFLSSGGLWRMDRDRAERVCNCGGTRLTAARIGRRVYVHTDTDQLVLEPGGFRKMGVPLPLGLSWSLGIGDLPPGRYLASATCIAPDGREGGAVTPVEIVLSSRSSITLTANPPPGYGARLYLSGQDGSELFHFADAVNATIRHPRELMTASRLLDRVGFGPLPTADILAAFRGHLLAATSEHLFWSRALDYEITDYTRNAVTMTAPITMLRPVTGGVFVGTLDGVVFLSGAKPAEWVVNHQLDFPVIQGTDVSVPMDRIGDGGVDRGVMFVTEHGVFVGGPDGSLTNVSGRKVRFPNADRGTASYSDGQYRVVVNGGYIYRIDGSSDSAIVFQGISDGASGTVGLGNAEFDLLISST